MQIKNKHWIILLICSCVLTHVLTKRSMPDKVIIESHDISKKKEDTESLKESGKLEETKKIQDKSSEVRVSKVTEYYENGQIKSQSENQEDLKKDYLNEIQFRNELIKDYEQKQLDLFVENKFLKSEVNKKFSIAGLFVYDFKERKIYNEFVLSYSIYSATMSIDLENDKINRVGLGLNYNF